MGFGGPHGRALSDSFNGWAKETYEHLGFVFATGVRSESPLENVQIRIGGPQETDVARATLGDLRRMRGPPAVYLSARDMQQLFVKSIETEDIRDKRGMPFQIFYGISGNTRRFRNTDNAREIIGLQPKDDSKTRFAELWIGRIGPHYQSGGPEARPVWSWGSTSGPNGTEPGKRLRYVAAICGPIGYADLKGRWVLISEAVLLGPPHSHLSGNGRAAEILREILPLPTLWCGPNWV